MSYIDIHCHLEMLADISEVISRAKKADGSISFTQAMYKQTGNRSNLL